MTNQNSNIDKEVKKNILLIGKTGSGKSALANVLTNSNFHWTNNYLILETNG